MTHLMTSEVYLWSLSRGHHHPRDNPVAVDALTWLTAAHWDCIPSEPAGGDSTRAMWVIPSGLSQHTGYEWQLGAALSVSGGVVNGQMHNGSEAQSAKWNVTDYTDVWQKVFGTTPSLPRLTQSGVGLFSDLEAAAVWLSHEQYSQLQGSMPFTALLHEHSSQHLF